MRRGRRSNRSPTARHDTPCCMRRAVPLRGCRAPTPSWTRGGDAIRAHALGAHAVPPRSSTTALRLRLQEGLKVTAPLSSPAALRPWLQKGLEVDVCRRGGELELERVQHRRVNRA